MCIATGQDQAVPSFDLEVVLSPAMVVSAKVSDVHFTAEGHAA